MSEVLGSHSRWPGAGLTAVQRARLAAVVASAPVASAPVMARLRGYLPRQVPGGAHRGTHPPAGPDL